MKASLEASWKEILADELSQDYFKNLISFVDQAYTTSTVYPPQSHIFNAFNHCPFDQVKVVILGQDPYHGPGQAHGLAFSVPDGIAIPPSLRNIFKEISQDIGTSPPSSGNLERWAHQGVLLLNATLTVEAGKAGSHQGKGWEEFTDTVIATISEHKRHVVFMLWGSYAQSKQTLIDSTKHLILTAPHPSPLSAHRGFFGSKHFSQTNMYLTQQGSAPIIW
ncbi:MAG: uracil-DNA glycosylase [Patescibacteria group bacterium]